MKGLAFRHSARELGIIPTRRKVAMQEKHTDKMRHMSFVLPREEHEAFRLLCFIWDISPSEGLRAMVRIALGGGYQQEKIKKGGSR